MRKVYTFKGILYLNKIILLFQINMLYLSDEVLIEIGTLL